MGIYATYNKTGGTVKDANDTIGKQVVGFLTAPFSFADDVTVTQKTQAVSVLGWGAISLLGGEYFGHMRARSGKGPLIPFLK